MSGDEGDSKRFLGRTSPIYPSSSTHVISVGGSSLAVGANNNYRFEVAWGTHTANQQGDHWNPHPPGPFLYGAGGGTSRKFHEPEYQEGVVPRRLTHCYGDDGAVDPDVGLVGDPNSGMLVGETQSFPNGGVHYDEYRIGGTSLLHL